MKMKNIFIALSLMVVFFFTIPGVVRSHSLPTPLGSTEVGQALKNSLNGSGKWSSITFADDTTQTTAAGDGSGDVVKVGTPSDNELAIWKSDGTIEGSPNVTYNDSAFAVEASLLFNNSGADKNSRFEGLTDTHLFFLDAGLDFVGIGEDVPRSKMEITTNGAVDLTAALRLTKAVDGSGSATGILFGAVASGGSKAGIFYTNKGVGQGRGNLTFAVNNTADISDTALSDAVMTLTNTGRVGIGRDDPNSALSMGDDDLITRDVNAGLTAGTTQTQGGGLALTAEINEISTCANESDTVVLPTAVAGLKIIIINNGANGVQIFPASSDNLGAGVDTARAANLATGTNVVFVSYDSTNWEEI